MPKPTAIKLSRKTVQKISYHLNLSEREVERDLNEYPKVIFYYVTDYVSRQMNPMPYAILMESSLLAEFASVPPGIEDNFVPVTQVKD